MGRLVYPASSAWGVGAVHSSYAERRSAQTERFVDSHRSGREVRKSMGEYVKKRKSRLYVKKGKSRLITV